MKTTIITILLMSFSCLSFASVTYKLDVTNNNSDQEIKIKNVKYKIKGSSWENVTKGGQVLSPNGGHRVFSKSNVIMTANSDRVWSVRLQCVGQPEFKVTKTCTKPNLDSNGSNTWDILEIKGCNAEEVSWFGGCE